MFNIVTRYSDYKYEVNIKRGLKKDQGFITPSAMRTMFAAAAVACAVFYVMNQYYSGLLTHTLKTSHQATSSSLAKKIDHEFFNTRNRAEELIRLSTRKNNTPEDLQKKINDDPAIVAFFAFKKDKEGNFTLIHQVANELAKLEYKINSDDWKLSPWPESTTNNEKMRFHHFLSNQPVDVFTLNQEKTIKREGKNDEHWRFRIELRKGLFAKLFSGSSSVDSFLIDHSGRLFLHKKKDLNAKSPAGKDMSDHPLVGHFLKNRGKRELIEYENRQGHQLWGSFHPLRTAPIVLITESSKQLIHKATDKTHYRTLLAATCATTLALFFTFFLRGPAAPSSSHNSSEDKRRLPLLPQGLMTSSPFESNSHWFIVKLMTSNPEGPYSLEQLKEMVSLGQLQVENSFVYRSGDLQMTPLYQVQGLERRQNNTAPVLNFEKPSPEVTAEADDEKNFFLKGQDGQLVGPYSAPELKSQLESGKISSVCPVWDQKLSTWVHLYQLPGFDRRAA